MKTIYWNDQIINIRYMNWIDMNFCNFYLKKYSPEYDFYTICIFYLYFILMNIFWYKILNISYTLIDKSVKLIIHIFVNIDLKNEIDIKQNKYHIFNMNL
jgi:hypothetical protein